MKILNAEQIRNTDRKTIENEPVPSIDLMERAALACTKRILELSEPGRGIIVICGEGNNGGDGFAIARQLFEKGRAVKVVAVNLKNERTPDAQVNFERLKKITGVKLIELHPSADLHSLKEDHSELTCIEALLGTGVNKPVTGFLSEVIGFINQNFNRIISIDVPAGLFIDESSANNKSIVRSSLVLTFQVPKLAFLLPCNSEFVPEFEILEIGLDKESLQFQESSLFYITLNDIRTLWKPRKKFSHKGTYGHALLLAGSRGTSGAAILAAKAAVRSGCGLLTLHSTPDTLQALLIAQPECMSSTDSCMEYISGIDLSDKFNAIAIGPGIGSHAETAQVLKKILNYAPGPLVIDADGLNILSENKTWLNFLPANTILTPHPKEFERLAGKAADDFDRLKLLKQFSIKYNCIVILKGAHSAIAMPDGNIFFNSSGNPGLAKGGSGDVLTGILVGLIARGYNAPQSALIGCFVHGFAADLCAGEMSVESICGGDVINKLAIAFKEIERPSN